MVVFVLLDDGENTAGVSRPVVPVDTGRAGSSPRRRRKTGTKPPNGPTSRAARRDHSCGISHIEACSARGSVLDTYLPLSGL